MSNTQQRTRNNTILLQIMKAIQQGSKLLPRIPNETSEEVRGWVIQSRGVTIYRFDQLKKEIFKLFPELGAENPEDIDYDDYDGLLYQYEQKCIPDNETADQTLFRLQISVLKEDELYQIMDAKHPEWRKTFLE